MPPESTRRPASRMFIPNHLALVQNVKVRLQSEGASLDGPCGAWRITNEVAWALRNEGAGLLDKPGGNNCRGYATDIVCYSDGTKVDILGDGGGANQPTWNVLDEPPQPERFRPALDPSEPIPGPNPNPEPLPGDHYPGDDKADDMGRILLADYHEAGRELDALSARWALRVCWDTVKGDETGRRFTFAESVAKHRAEWRRELRLPPS